MGVYIAGMSLPKDGCKSCVFDIVGICLIEANMDKPHEVTHSCPIIELPPHGRLGDLDALFDKAYTAYGVDMDEHEANQMMEMVSSAPTIIPADPEKEDK